MEVDARRSGEENSPQTKSLDQVGLPFQAILASSAFLTSPLVGWEPKSEKAVTITLAIVIILISTGAIEFVEDHFSVYNSITISASKPIFIATMCATLLYYYVQLMIAYYRAHSQWKLRAAVFAASILPIHAAAGTALARHRELLAAFGKQKLADIQAAIDRKRRFEARCVLIDEICDAICARLDEGAPDALPASTQEVPQEVRLQDGTTLVRPTFQHKFLTPISDIVIQDAKPKLFESNLFDDTEKKNILLALIKAPHDRHGISSLILDIKQKYCFITATNSDKIDSDVEISEGSPLARYRIELEIISKVTAPARNLFFINLLWDLLLPSVLFFVAIGCAFSIAFK